MQRIIRQSEIKKFKRCRRSWLLAYHRQLSKVIEDENSKAKLGTLVHSGLEGYYKDGSDPVAVVQAWYDGLTLEQQADKAIINRLSYARPMLRGYLHWLEETGADAGITVLSTENRLELPFGTVLGDEIVLTGQIDLSIIDAYGVPRAVDHKSVQSLDQMDRILQVDDQLLTYATLRKLIEGVEIHSGMHNMLRRVKHGPQSKPPYFGRKEVSFNETQMRNHMTHLTYTLNEMVAMYQYLENGGDIHAAVPNANKDCAWDCPFLGACAMVDDGSDFELYLADNFEVKLVDVEEEEGDI